MTTYSSILAWRIPWTEEPGGLESTGSRRVMALLSTAWHQTFKLYFKKHTVYYLLVDLGRLIEILIQYLPSFIVSFAIYENNTHNSMCIMEKPQTKRKKSNIATMLILFSNHERIYTNDQNKKSLTTLYVI